MTSLRRRLDRLEAAARAVPFHWVTFAEVERAAPDRMTGADRILLDQVLTQPCGRLVAEPAYQDVWSRWAEVFHATARELNVRYVLDAEDHWC